MTTLYMKEMIIILYSAPRHTDTDLLLAESLSASLSARHNIGVARRSFIADFFR